MLVDSDFESNLIADISVNNEIYESIGVEIKINNETYAILSVYRPPSSSIPEFNTNFFQLINSVPNPCIILGDFFIDTIATIRSAAGIGFTDRTSCLGYDSLIKIPTRKTSSTATCIGHIYVKSTTSIRSGVLGMHVSKNGATFFSLIDQTPVNHLKNIKFRDQSD